MARLKELLKDKLSEQESKLVPNSYDQIGTIAIFQDFPKELKKKEKLIAETLIRNNKNVKTVAIKTKKHSGKYRLKEVKIIAGEKTKETIHKENNIYVKLDVEKCYFSPRLNNERLRIAGQIKKNEEILVMFSGIGIYPLVIAKNTEAKQVYGIEINPVAHKYGLENIRLNNAKNVTLVKGDVKKVLPGFFQHIIGLKSAFYTTQLKTRLEKNPELIEIQLLGGDLENKLKDLRMKLHKLQNKDIRIFIHQPFTKYKNIQLALNQEVISFEAYRTIIDMCKKYNAKCIIHPTFFQDKTMDVPLLIKNIKTLESYYRYIYFENTRHEKYFSDIENIMHIIRECKIPNFCIDLSHFYNTYKSQEKLIDNIIRIQERCHTYFHVHDSNESEESMEIESGVLDFQKILQYIGQGSLEVISKDENKAEEMLRSFDKLKRYTKKFDRIIMPLPKSSESFLDLAKKHLKENGIIHFYDFSREEDFPESSVKKIKKHFKNLKILNTIKCGQYSAGKFRVCIDFQA